MSKVYFIFLVGILLLTGCGENTTKYSDTNVSDSSVQGTKIIQDITYSREAGIDGDLLYFIAPTTGYYRITFDTALQYEYYFYFSIKTGTEEREVEDNIAFIELTEGEAVDIRLIYDRSFTSTAPYTITLTSATTISEGSIVAPVLLSLKSTYYTEVGISAIGGDSYYRFTTDEAGNYAITASSTRVDLVLHQRASFDYPLEESAAGVLREILDANTTYYLKASNDGSEDIQFSLRITREDEGNEGEIGDPVILTQDLTHRGKVGYDDWNEDSSYYQFTTESNVSLYVISLLNPTTTYPLYFSVYKDSSFENLLSAVTSSGRLQMELEPSTTYYLKVKNYFDNAVNQYDLTVSKPEGPVTITDIEYLHSSPVQLQADIEYKANVSTLSGNGTESFYTYTVGSEVKPTLIAFTKEDDLVLYMYNDSNYSDEIDFSYTSPYLLSDPEAGKKYYIKILNYTNSDTVTYSLLIQPDP